MHLSKRQQIVGLVGSCVLMMFYIIVLQHGVLDKLQIIRYEKRVRINDAFINVLAIKLKDDKGTGCIVPKLDPFSKEIMQFDDKTLPINCRLRDWVKCYFSKCKIESDILKDLGEDKLKCTIRDILYKTDKKYALGPPTVLKGDEVYYLAKSDHVSIKCTRTSKIDNTSTNATIWEGLGVGYRPITIKKPPAGTENAPNVLIFAFDSTSRNGFIRKMPKSYKYITEELGAADFTKFNIVGDGTIPNIFPLLTGLTQFEHPECRISYDNSGYVKEKLFIFAKAKEQGYRTAYYEDVSSGGEPLGGTFQLYLNGFEHQPTDHYLRDAFDEELKIRKRTNDRMGSYKCFGGTPRFKVMMNLTAQFFKFKGKRFAFTFISDISHDDFNRITNADEPFVQFLEGLRKDGRLKDTLLIVMSDHGPRFSDLRSTFQGKLEERLPFLAIRLPDDFKFKRPDAEVNLKSNTDTLTTPHDIHSTVLDVINMREHWNTFKIEGSNLMRGMTLLEKISKFRSCSEAGVLPHWCTCMRWITVEPLDPMRGRLAQALLDHINNIVQFQRNQCLVRTLSSIVWVLKQSLNKKILLNEYAQSDNETNNDNLVQPEQLYQIKITVDPGNSSFEATATHYLESDKIYLNTTDISRTNAYKEESACVRATYPHLSKYCFCKKALNLTGN